jgi:hypothetical protein
MTLSQVDVESGVVVVTLGLEWTNADVVALVDTIGTLIRGDNGVRRVLVRIEGETPGPSCTWSACSIERRATVAASTWSSRLRRSRRSLSLSPVGPSLVRNTFSVGPTPFALLSYVARPR